MKILFINPSNVHAMRHAGPQEAVFMDPAAGCVISHTHVWYDETLGRDGGAWRPIAGFPAYRADGM